MLTATIATSPTGRTGTLFTALITNPATGAYTLTLVQPVLHLSLDGMIGDNTENDVDIALAYQLRDQDNDLSATAGVLNVKFDDDMPVAVVTQNAVVTNGTGSGSFNLDTATTINNLADNYGADGAGTVRFSASTAGLPDLTSNGVAITYTVSGDGLVLTGTAGLTTVFTVTLNPPTDRCRRRNRKSRR